MFISHSSKNNAEAVAVRDWLRGEGYAETFLDLDPEHGTAPGQRCEEEPQKAGERCLAVVVLISPDGSTSKWCFWDADAGEQIGSALQHEDSIFGAAYSKDETCIRSWSADNTVRLWDVKGAMKLRATPEDVAEICNLRLRGSLAHTRRGTEAPFPRLIDGEMIAAASIPQVREGEDVCAVQKLPWWDMPQQIGRASCRERVE